MQCVRCRKDTAKKIASAPDGSGAWEVHYCNNCNFSWRSTEEDDVINAEKRDSYFQLENEDLTKLLVPVPVPPLTPTR